MFAVVFFAFLFFCPNNANAGTWTSSGANVYYTGGYVGIGDTGAPPSPLVVWRSSGSTAIQIINKDAGGDTGSIAIGNDSRINGYMFLGTPLTGGGEFLHGVQISVDGEGSTDLFRAIDDSVANPVFRITEDGDVRILNGNLYLGDDKISTSTGSISDLLMSHEDDSGLNDIGTIQINGYVGAFDVRLDISVPFFYWLMLFLIILICTIILIRNR